MELGLQVGVEFDNDNFGKDSHGPSHQVGTAGHVRSSSHWGRVGHCPASQGGEGRGIGVLED